MAYAYGLEPYGETRGGSTPLSGTFNKTGIDTNMKYTQLSFQKNTYVFSVVIEKSEIEAEEKKAFASLTSNLEVEGFRRSKAPESVAKKHIKPDSIIEAVANSILPEIYRKIVTENKLSPLLDPKIDFKKVKPGEDWELEVTIAVRPEITLPDYKKIVADIKAKSKIADIWVPGQVKVKGNEDNEKVRQQALDEIISTIASQAKIEIPELLVETELNKRLTHLLDDVRKVGLTIESYLASKSQTLEALKSEFRAEIEAAYRLELVLDSLADKESIVVSDDELKSTIDKLKSENPNAIHEIEHNTYMYAIILRRQKLLEFLSGL